VKSEMLMKKVEKNMRNNSNFVTCYSLQEICTLSLENVKEGAILKTKYR
jgi:hypothetical protein